MTVWDNLPIYVHDHSTTGHDEKFDASIDEYHYLRAVNGGRCERSCFFGKMIDEEVADEWDRWMATSLVNSYFKLCRAWTMGTKGPMFGWSSILVDDDWEKHVLRAG